MLHKSIPALVKDLDTAQGIVTVYASSFGIEDDGADIVRPGAFTKTIGEWGPTAPQPRIKWLWQHDAKALIGTPLELRQDDFGLLARGQAAPTTLGKDTLILYEYKVITEHSIGYEAIDTSYDRKTGVRNLLTLRLYEYSSVTWGMNSQTPTVGIKSMDGADRLAALAVHVQRLDDCLHNAHFNTEEVPLHLERQYKSLSALLPAHDDSQPWEITSMEPEQQEQKAATGDDKKAQEARSKKYGIGIKDGGSVTKPGKWDSLSDDDFGDPVNYSSPMPDKEHADNAAARFATPDGLGEYTAKEQDIVAKRIMKKQASFGEKPDWWPLKDDSGDSGKSADAPTTSKALDFNTAFTQLSAADALQDEWGDSFQALVSSLYGVMLQGNQPGDSGAQDMADTVLEQFTAHMSDLVKRSLAAQFTPCLDDDGDSFYDPDGPNASEGDDDSDYGDMGYGMMSAGNLVADIKAFREGKAGRTISADNHMMMSKALDMIGEGHKALSAFVQANDPKNPGDEPPQQSDSVYDPGFGKSTTARNANRTRAGARPAHPHATTAEKVAGARDGVDTTATTHSGMTDTAMTPESDDVARFRALMADIRQHQHTAAPVAG